MSYLKDSKYVKTIASTSNFKELTEEACRFILSEVELTLRKVILKSGKYAKKFKRNNINTKDLEIVLDDMNLDFILKGKSFCKDEYNVDEDSSNFKIDSKDMCIKSTMNDIILNRLKKKKKMKLHLDWFVINGKIMKDIGFEVVNKKKINGDGVLKKKVSLEISDMKNFLNKQGLKTQQNIYFIKKLNPNVLTKVK